ncbi:SDR family oxidoreductase [Leifsonia sp. H3M29-4]|uniref:SDR family oxidoreductase n=1 Tax=Salinibacterium metalliresistens TaxID=3031321 RepID=UPI0023D9D4A8|nr:SDR family oxidoreductase [Salinibacterium metalliresistens]MDF1479250.1 SDR family oxidoreductase [Salinibacterium metalliresistens]
MVQRAVLVTGASTGIGRATALLLDAQGWTVFAGVRKRQDGEALAAAASGPLVPLMLDVTKPRQIEAAAKAIGERGIPLKGLVNNAGIASAAPLEFVPIDDFRHQLEVNVVGQLAVIKAVLPLLRSAKGRIVNVTSIAGLIAGQMLGPYSASKFALEALTHTLRQELAPWGIEAIAIEPGQIATPIWSTSAASADRMLGPVLPQVTSLYGRQLRAASRMAERAARDGLPPEEVAKVIARALTAKHPRTRYPVGTDAKLGAALVARLPDRVRDRLLGGRRAAQGS